MRVRVQNPHFLGGPGPSSPGPGQMARPGQDLNYSLTVEFPTVFLLVRYNFNIGLFVRISEVLYFFTQLISKLLNYFLLKISALLYIVMDSGSETRENSSAREEDKDEEFLPGDDEHEEEKEIE